MIRRYEIRSAEAVTILLEGPDSRGLLARYVHLRPDPLTTEIWRVNLEERDGALVETGSWPIIPATRAEARFA